MEGRGKKKKKGGAGAASCDAKGLDCSATCCLDSVCATDLADCAGYVNREFSEIYTGVEVLVSLILGIPLIIAIFNFCLMFKFCQKVDDEDNTKYGGYTICEMI